MAANVMKVEKSLLCQQQLSVYIPWSGEINQDTTVDVTMFIHWRLYHSFNTCLIVFFCLGSAGSMRRILGFNLIPNSQL